LFVMRSAGSRPITFAVRGPIEHADLPGLCDRVCTLLAGRPGALVRCDVAGVPADAITVEALARLQLAAQRNSCRVGLLNASPELLELVALMGLGDVLHGA
jgi:ABC-type transporter Mla MlaB component